VAAPFSGVSMNGFARARSGRAYQPAPPQMSVATTPGWTLLAVTLVPERRRANSRVKSTLASFERR